jgi:hypothetical protein
MDLKFRVHDRRGAISIGPIFLVSLIFVGFWNLVFPWFRDRAFMNAAVAFLEFISLSGAYYLYMRWIYDYDGDLVKLWLIAGIFHLVVLFIHLGVLLMLRGSRKIKVK